MIATDSLAAILGALGDPLRDKAAGVYYTPTFLTDLQLVLCYRSSWLGRKIVDIPAADTVRAWREWKAEADQIEKIEAEEQRLGVRGKVRVALGRARLFGGAAIYIGTNDKDLSQPFDAERVGAGDIKYLSVISKSRISPQDMNMDPTSEFFEQPAYYTVNNLTIHPSRLIRFVGAPVIDPAMNFPTFDGWGESVLLPLWDAIRRFDSSFANVNSMLFEANIDVFGVENLLTSASNVAFQKKLIERFSLVAANKGVNGSILKDASETFERKAMSFGGIAEILDRFMQETSGAADIPATRLLGMSPGGLNASGESDLRNYYDRISSEQTLTLDPTLERFNEALIRSALGNRPDQIYYEWSPLWQRTPKENAEIGKATAEMASSLNQTGLFPQEALAKTVANQLTELGVLPGFDQAIDENPIDWGAELEIQEKEREARMNPTPAPGFTADMAPRPLYVMRPVVNAAEILAWADGQGLTDPLAASDLHATIVYSRDPVDWFKVGEPWESKLTIAAGGPRLVERFGDAIVLRFASRELQYRHEVARAAGASHDFPEYAPHITITYRNDRIDVDRIEAFQGEIVLGPEVFRALEPGWRPK